MDIKEKHVIIGLLIVVAVAASTNAWAVFTGHIGLSAVVGCVFGTISVATVSAIPIAVKYA